MKDREAELEAAAREVEQAQRHVTTQRRILAHIRELGGSTDLAEALLTEFENTLKDREARLERLQEAGRASG